MPASHKVVSGNVPAIEEVVVAVQKRAESARDMTVAITTAGSETWENMSAIMGFGKGCLHGI